ncbi:MBL fold metallo-hydrolase [Sinirhodobacter sp. HNIBRBA609]|nr:MBL fold metallo-hydrolase [Sinirhodobacter sp. HNIBRBA609]
MTIRLNRRTALATAGLAFATPALLLGRAAVAQGTTAPPAAIPPYRRMMLGHFTVTTLLAATGKMEEPQSVFGMNASPEEFAALSEAAFIPADRSFSFFTPTLVETGGEKILFDTGLSADGIRAALGAAGHDAGSITTVVLTHMHPDHIGGLSDDAGATFANATYVTGQAEFDHWAATGNEGFEAKVRPLAEKMRFLGDGEDVATGVTSVLAAGHTPGHMAYWLQSEGRELVLTADTANHHVWSLQKPDWEVRYDADKAAAAATRRSLLGRIAGDKVPFVGYHMPFPGVGYLETKDDGFRFVPASYQLDL